MDLLDNSPFHGWSDCAYRKQRPLPPLAQTPLPANVGSCRLLCPTQIPSCRLTKAVLCLDTVQHIM